MTREREAREQRLAQEREQARAQAVTPVSKPTPALAPTVGEQIKGRVLQARGHAEEEARAAQARAQAEAQKAPKGLRKTKEAEAQKPGKDPERRAKNIANNQLANDIMAKGGAEFLPSAAEEKYAEEARGASGKEARDAIKERVAKIVEIGRAHV